MSATIAPFDIRRALTRRIARKLQRSGIHASADTLRTAGLRACQARRYTSQRIAVDNAAAWVTGSPTPPSAA